MKAILKTLPKDLDLAYNETFTSEANLDILQELVPQIRSSMALKYKLSYNQVRTWLAALHKHRRVRLLYKERGTLDKDNRRLHKNNRLNEVKKALFRFYKKKPINILRKLEKSEKTQGCRFAYT